MARDLNISASLGDTLDRGPVRTCIGCRKRATKRELLRVTAGSGADGPVVVPDPGATAPGRGAHLHPTAECYELAVRRKAFARALRLQGNTSVRLSTTPVSDYLARARPTEEFSE